MGIELVVLDFDGTLTDVDKEAVSFVDGYKNDLVKDLGIRRFKLEDLWNEAESIVDNNQASYGWKVDGKIVAPAYADPFIHSDSVAAVLMDKAGMYLTEEERQAALGRYFQSNYEKTTTVFKKETDKFLSAIKKKFEVFIVTNSRTHMVTRKIKQLPTDHSGIPVLGSAKKYLLSPEWKEVPESVEKEGFGRPLFLRRQQYWNVLSGIMSEQGARPENVAVVGDIYELDLLLPEHKGMNIILTTRESTPKFEVEAVRTSSLGYAAKTLTEVLAHLESYH